jgi:polyhydroxyalkanoate synthesis regulator phasin
MKLPTKALALGAAVIVIAAGTFGAFRYASAQEGTPSADSTPSASSTPTKRQQAVDAFIDKVATNLNIPSDQLKAAVKDAALQTVDEQVASGKLTQEQGDKIKAAINSGKYPELRRLFEARQTIVRRVERGIVGSAAKAIGISPQGLASQLKSGKSIADVADEHKVPLDDVKSQITTAFQAKLDQLVKDGKISQTQEDNAMQKLQANLDKILNHHRGDGSPNGASATPGA